MSPPLPDLDPGFSTPAMDAIFSVEARVAAFCRVEAALALARADTGEIDHATATAAAEACAAPVDDPAVILRDGWVTGTPLIPLLSALRERLDAEAGGALHRGATTQDIVDTATMLQARDGLESLVGDITTIGGRLAELAAAERGTPMAGRTFLQQAGAITFGALAAGWLGSFAGRRSTLEAVRASLPVQLAGPVGTGSTLGSDPDGLAVAFANRLGLSVPPLPWQSDRAPIRTVVSVVAELSSLTATIATDLVLLAQTEVGEVRMRPGGSTAVADKRNPFDAVHAIAAAEACAGCAGIVASPRPFELQRGVGGWHAEWFVIPLVFRTAGAAIEALGTAVETLEIDAERMRQNLAADPTEAELAAATRMVDRALADWDRSERT